MRNNKGFTMVELLAAIAILGLLMIMAFPTMRAVQSRNEKKKYEEYGHAMLSAAKLYTDSYAEDLFPKGYKNDYATIKSTDLVKKDLLKTDGFNDVSCANDESTVVVAKYGDDYQYCLSMKCKNKSNQKVYEDINKEGSCKNYATRKITYLYKSPVGDVKHVDEVIKGDDAYYTLDPSSFGNFNFSSNHQVFLKSWTVQGTSTTYGVGSLVDKSLLKNDITLVANTRQYKYYVNYYGNGQTAGANFKQECEYDRNCILAPANSFARTYYSFVSWRDGANTSYIASGSYKNLVATDGGSINFSAAWKYNECALNKGWNQEFPTDAQVLANGSSTTGLSYVNTYKWVHNSDGDKCTGDNPKREYYFEGFMCRCIVDYLTGKYCGGIEARRITHITHPHGTAHIYYTDSTEGRKACKGEYNVNSYVARVCKSFYPDGVNAYHGYVFYPGPVGAYADFSPNTYWTHSGGNFNDREPSWAGVDVACDKACKAKYPH